MSRNYRVGIDIGGTFTDFAVVGDGRVYVEKVLTTSDQPERAVLEGLARLNEVLPNLLGEAEDVVHATTLVTNVVLEGKGAKTALITTKGFRDILEIGREVRYTVFDMFIRYPKPLVPRNLRFEVSERTLSDGTIIDPLDEAGMHAIAETLREQMVEAVAVCFLHGYRNPANEMRAVEILRKALPNVEISASYEVHPEPKEYERTSTTVVDAYVKRVVSHYLERLADGLRQRDYRNNLFIMLSNGGTATVDTARRFPVQMLESGPAAGVEAAGFFGKLADLGPILAFDMGGTTAKLCIVEDGRAARTRNFEVARVHRFIAGSGYPVTIPVYDLLEIGAGGGSIARINDLGLIEVGPASAGSAPGPACYGRGGAQPTVTDADLVLGHLNADYFLGGDMKLDRKAAEAAIGTHLARPTGLSPMAAAFGIYQIVNENMAAAARIYITEKGKVASRLTLVSSGGAGPAHAVDLARKLGVRRVVVPPHSGVMSSLGLLTAPLAFERSRSIRQLLEATDVARLDSIFAELESDAASVLPPGANKVFERSLDLRYSGQDYALEIPAGPAGDRKARWKADFLAAYEAQYGTVDDDNPIELAAIRIQVRQPFEPLAIKGATHAADAAPKATRDMFIANLGDVRRVPVYERTTLGIGQVIAGPAVIEERESTTIVGEGDRVIVDRIGCLVIAVAAAVSAPADATQLELAGA